MKFACLFFCSLFPTISLLRAEHPMGEPRPAPGAATLSLDAITGAALADNPSLKAARANWEAMKARVPQAAAWEDLSMSFNTRSGRFVDVAPNGFTDQTFTIEQKLPLGGKNLSRARAVSAEAAAAYEELRRRRLDVTARVKAAYYRLANASAQLDLNRRNEELLRDFAQLSRRRYEVGMQTQAETLAAETERARIVEARADLERTRADAQSALNVLMNRPARSPLGQPAPVSVGDAMRLPTAARLESLAMLFRPELRIAGKKIDAAQARLQLARRDWTPEPTLRLGAQRYNAASQAISEVDVGFTVNLPWLNSPKYEAQARESRAALAEANENLAQSRSETRGLVNDQLNKIETFHHHYEVYRDEILPLARQTVLSSQTSYETGKSGFLEYLSTQRTLRDAEAESLMHQADYLTALAELEAIVGADFKSTDAQK